MISTYTQLLNVLNNIPTYLSGDAVSATTGAQSILQMAVGG